MNLGEVRMAYEDIKIQKEEKVATITIDRPDTLNAIRYHTMVEIGDALNNIEIDESIRVVVITGAGNKAFISGGDISVMAKDEGYIKTLSEVPKGQQITTQIENFPKPVIARINGIALGGGTEIALCCDIRIAAETAIMGVPEIKLGIIPGYGGTQRLPRVIGMAKAKELVLTGSHITAQEAYRIGLVNEVVPLAQLDNAVMKYAKKLSSKAPIALRMAKESLNIGTQADLKTGLDIEARCFTICYATEDRVEGMKAFMEKREPNFKGK
jgi:enoyl-CoA hydratase